MLKSNSLFGSTNTAKQGIAFKVVESLIGL